MSNNNCLCNLLACKDCNPGGWLQQKPCHELADDVNRWEDSAAFWNTAACAIARQLDSRHTKHILLVNEALAYLQNGRPEKAAILLQEEQSRIQRERFLPIEEIKAGSFWTSCDGAGIVVQVNCIDVQAGDVHYSWREKTGELKSHSKDSFSFQVRYTQC